MKIGATGSENVGNHFQKTLYTPHEMDDQQSKL